MNNIYIVCGGPPSWVAQPHPPSVLQGWPFLPCPQRKSSLLPDIHRNWQRIRLKSCSADLFPTLLLIAVIGSGHRIKRAGQGLLLHPTCGLWKATTDTVSLKYSSTGTCLHINLMCISKHITTKHCTAEVIRVCIKDLKHRLVLSIPKLGCCNTIIKIALLFQRTSNIIYNFHLFSLFNIPLK